MLLVVVGYAIGPIIISRQLSDLPSMGVVTASLILAAVIYAPFTPFVRPPNLTPSAVISVVVLAVFCTAIAFLVMFALIAEAGPARMTLITYVNPAVALLLGALVLHEPITLGLVVGFPLVIVGSILGTWGRAAPPPDASGVRRRDRRGRPRRGVPAPLTRSRWRPLIGRHRFRIAGCPRLWAIRARIRRRPPPRGDSMTAVAAAAGAAGRVAHGRPDRPRRTAYRPHVPTWGRDVVGVLTWASMLVVVALWVGGGNVQDLAGWGTGLTAVGRLTGLVASDLLLIQVLLMARIPLVERVYGQDELARRHRLVGFWSVNLMVAHILVVTVGYAVQARTNVFAEAWDLVVDYPGILLAVAGAGLLLLVAVTSIRKARRKLRYESWHLLHLYAYLGVGLALPHQLWSGQEFMSSTVASVYWWTLWGAAAGAILVWRVGAAALPDPHPPAARRRRRARERRGGVGRHDRPAPRPAPRRRRQFFVWRFLDAPGWTRGHPYSLSAAPTADTLRITVKDLGDASRGLAHVRPGTRVAVEGPYGRLHEGVRTRRKVLLLPVGSASPRCAACSRRSRRSRAT